MDVISIIGVSRGNEYSPNHVDNDAAIFYKVTEELRRLGCANKERDKTNKKNRFHALRRILPSHLANVRL